MVTAANYLSSQSGTHAIHSYGSLKFQVYVMMHITSPIEETQMLVANDSRRKPIAERSAKTKVRETMCNLLATEQKVS